MLVIYVRFVFGSRAAKVKKSEKSAKSEYHLHTSIKSSTFAPNL